MPQCWRVAALSRFSPPGRQATIKESTWREERRIRRVLPMAAVIRDKFRFVILSIDGTHSAGMAELADAADSKSAGPRGHGGSTPPPGTNSILLNLLDLAEN